MFNPQFRKFRRKKVFTSKLKSNQINDHHSPELNTCELGNEVGLKPKRSKTDDTSTSSGTWKERLSQFSHKRLNESQSSSSSKVKKTPRVTEKIEKSNVKLTPFEEQVMELKLKYPGMILIIKSGYKYLLYNEDAEIATKLLNLTLCSNCNSVRCSFPEHRLYVYVRALTEFGYKVGVIKQLEVAELKAVGENKNKLFDRELSAIYSKGTAIGEDINPLETLNNKCPEEASPRFIMCVAEINEKSLKPNLGIVAFDVGTGEAYYDQFEDNNNREELEKRVEHLRPAEVVVSEKLSKPSEIVLKHSKPRMEVWPEDKFSFSFALLETASFLSSSSANAEEITNLPPAVVCALAALLNYLKSCVLENTLKPENLQSFSKSELYVELDAATLRNLEIFRTLNDSHEGSLFSLFDAHSHTRFGSRVLREWLSRPLRDIETLRLRQDAVAELLDCTARSVVELHQVLSKIPDLEHGLTSVVLKRCSALSTYLIIEHLTTLKIRLEAIIGTSNIIRSPLLNKLILESAQCLRNVSSFQNNIDKTAVRKGDITKSLRDYSSYPKVVELQSQVLSIENQLNSLLPRIASQLGLTDVKYTSVSGMEYMIEVKINRSVPLDWQKVSETKALSRYRPPDVLELHSELRFLKAQLAQECQNAWLQYIDSFNVFYSDHKKAVKNVAVLDALIALSQLARTDGYCRPYLTDDDIVINIQRGKHPIVSKIVDNFIANNTYLENPENPVMVLSGPNMGGKSCYVKQVALITILALIGSYVPAESATIGMIDAIFTRIGARDEILHGHSTLFIEMQECSRILHRASRYSLVIIDELGRGTNSNDGAAITFASLSHFMEKIQCLLLFITHYPSVMDFAPHCNYHMGFLIAKFGQDDSLELLTFLYLITEGKTPSSYGINVARLAGIPEKMLQNAAFRAKHFQELEESDEKSRFCFRNLWNAGTLRDLRNSLNAESENIKLVL